MKTTTHAASAMTVGAVAAAAIALIASAPPPLVGSANAAVLDDDGASVASGQPGAGGGRGATERREGDLRLGDGAEWPTDDRLVARLREVSAELGKPLVIVSGKREMGNRRNPAKGTQWYFWNLYVSGRGNLAAYPNKNAPHIRGIAADVNIVQPDGSYTDVGAYATGRKLLRKHKLVLSVPSEGWHVEPAEESDWGYWQKP